MATQISGAGLVNPRTWELVRDSDGDLIYATHDTSSSTFYCWVSQDDGSTWTQYGEIPGDATGDDGISLYLDSNGRYHTVVKDTSDASTYTYHRFTVDKTNQNITIGVTDNQFYSTSNGAYSGQIWLNSSGTVWAYLLDTVKNMGTNYTHLAVAERTGSGSWTTHDTLTGTIDRTVCGSVIDSNDVIHSVHSNYKASRPYPVYYASFDTSTQSWGSETQFASAYTYWVGRPILDSNGNLYTTFADKDTRDGYLWRRLSSDGTWERTRYSTKECDDAGITIINGRFHLLGTYENTSSGYWELSYNSGTWSGLDPANEITVQSSSSSSMQNGVAPWQPKNYYPDTTTLHYAFEAYDETQSYYDSETIPISVSVSLSGSGVDATVYVINDSTGSMETVTNTGSDGNVSITVSDTSANYHVAVEYTDGSGNEYNAISQPYVSTGDNVSFSLDSYTPPDPTNTDFSLS